jgi:hypothetical protein
MTEYGSLRERWRKEWDANTEKEANAARHLAYQKSKLKIALEKIPGATLIDVLESGPPIRALLEINGVGQCEIVLINEHWDHKHIEINLQGSSQNS